MRYTVILRHVVHGTWERAEFVLARFHDRLAAVRFCRAARPVFAPGQRVSGKLFVVDSLEQQTVWEG